MTIRAAVSILLYGCTTRTLTKRMEKNLDSNYTRTLRAVLNKSRRKNPPKQQLYGHQPPITTTIKVRRTTHSGHCWRSKDEFISDILLWTPSHGRVKAGQSAGTYIQQRCVNTGFSLEDHPEAMDDRDEWRERVREIRASCATWWRWWWWSTYMICKHILFITFFHEPEIILLLTVKWFYVLLCN